MVRSSSKARLLEAGLAVLCRDAVSGVEKLLSPEALQAATREDNGAEGGVSRHTAYRLWGTDRGQAIVDLAEHIADVGRDRARTVRSAVVAAHTAAMRDLEIGRETQRPGRNERAMKEAFREPIRVIVELELTSTAMPASWALQAAAMSSSPLWRGDRPSEGLQETGRQILAARAAFYRHVTSLWTEVLDGLLVLWGRRAGEQVTDSMLVQMVTGLFDGFLLRIFADCELNDPDIAEPERDRRLHDAVDLAADAMFDLLWTYTVDAAVDDPRYPVDDATDDDRAAYESLVARAVRLYAGPTIGQVVDPVSVAADAGIDTAQAARLFPEAADLADSALRHLVAPSGLDFSISKFVNPRPLIELALWRLKRAVATHPDLVAAARSDASTDPAQVGPLLIDHLTAEIGGALDAPTAHCPDPTRTAHSLIEFTLNPERGWQGVETILTLITEPDTSNENRRPGQAGGG